MWPADQTQPNASNLNWDAGQDAVPNQVTTALSATGTIDMFSPNGTVDVIVDITGYLTSPPADPCKAAPAHGLDWTGCDLAGRDFTGQDLRLITLTGADFAGANLTSTTFANQSLLGANLSAVNPTGSYFRNNNLIGASLTGANLTNADLGYSNLTQSDLIGVTWSHTKCPDGTFSDTNGTSPQSCLGHL